MLLTSTLFDKLGIDSTSSWGNPHSEIMTQEKMASCPDLLSCSCSFNIQLLCLSLTLADRCLSLCHCLTFLSGLYSHRSSIMEAQPTTQDCCLWTPLDASALPLLSWPKSPKSLAKRGSSVFFSPLFRFRGCHDFSGIRLPYQQEICCFNNSTKS